MKKVLKTLALMGINVVLAVSSLAPCTLTAVAADYSTEGSEEIHVFTDEDESSEDAIEGDEGNKEEISLEDEDETILDIEEDAENAEGAENAEDAELTEITEASGKCGKNATWSINNYGTLFIKGTGAMYDYTKEEPAPWHEYNAKIQMISVGDGITRIGNYAFERVGYKVLNGMLLSIYIGYSVTEIGDYAFKDCSFNSSGDTVKIPDSVTKLGKGSFENFNMNASKDGPHNYSGGTIIIGKGVKVIPEECFSNAVALKLVIPEGVERVEKKGLYSFRGPYDIEFPSTLKYIAEEGCAYYKSDNQNSYFRNITFKGNMPKLETNAFGGHTSYVFYPAGDSTYTEKSIANAKKAFVASTWRPSDYVTDHKAGNDITWSMSTFDAGEYIYRVLELNGTGTMYDYSLDNLPDWFPERDDYDVIKLDSRITSIGDYAFYDFRGVNNNYGYPLVLPPKLTRIGDHAFENDFIMEMVLPEEVAYIGDYAFCSSTLMDDYDAIFPKGVKYIGDYPWPDNIRMNVDLEGIEHIGRGVFAGNRYTIESPALPDSLTYIGAGAFKNNTTLSGELFIPDSVTYVGAKAFYGCTKLTGKVKLLGVTSIENQVFTGTEITELIYGGRVTSVGTIEGYSFSKALTQVTFYNKYFKNMQDVFKSLNKSGHKISVCYPSGKGWPAKYSYDKLDFNVFSDCQVTFVYPDGHTSVKTVAIGKKATTPTDLKLAEGVSLVGWFTGKRIVKSSQWDFDTPVSHDMTLYAKTTEDTCEVGFIVPYSLDNLGYTHYDSRVDVKYGEKVKEYRATMKGGRFRGWFADKDCTVPFDFEQPITEDTTVYSKWEKADVIDFSKDTDRLVYDKDLYVEYSARYIRLSPVVKVKYSDGYDTLQAGADYIVDPANYRIGEKFKSVGDYTITLKGRGNCTGELKVTQHIAPVDLGETEKFRPVSGQTYKYDGKVHKYTPYIVMEKDDVNYALSKDKDYTLEYVDEDKDGCFKDPGEYKIIVTGIGNFKGKIEVTEIITGEIKPDPKPEPVPDPKPTPKVKCKSITKAKVTGLQNCVFDGTPHNDQKLTVKYGDEVLQEGVHYTLEWKKYFYPGTGKVVVKGVKENGYSGKKTLTFKIAKADINDMMIVEVPETATYTKGKTTPEVKVYYKTADGEKFLLEGNEYFKISYKNNTKVNDGTGKKVPTVVVTGKKYFKGTVKKTFKITPSSITNCKASAKDIKYKKGKGNFKSKIVVTDSNGKKLTAGKDYDAKNMVFTVESTGKVLGKKDSVDLDTTIVVKIRGLGNYASSEEISCTYKVTK